jgi:hypothetical protein
MPYPYDASKPTLVLVNSFTTDSNLYRDQFADEELTDEMNLIAIEYVFRQLTYQAYQNLQSDLQC